MVEKHMTSTGHDKEDAYFHDKDLTLLTKRRAELDARREAFTSRKLKCPRCGADIIEVVIDRGKVDRCTGCGGIFLYKGELEILTLAKSGGFFKRLFGRSSLRFAL